MACSTAEGATEVSSPVLSRHQGTGTGETSAGTAWGTHGTTRVPLPAGAPPHTLLSRAKGDRLLLSQEMGVLLCTLDFLRVCR